MLEIQFQIEGVTQLHRRISKIADGIKDWSPATEQIGQYLTNFFSNDVFKSEGAVFGEKWKGGKYYHQLQRTGLMRRSFIYKSDKSQVEIGNSTPYFIYHQSNQPRKSNLPRRIMMKLDEARKQKVVKFFQMQIKGLIG